MIVLDTLSIAAVGVGNHEYPVKSGSPEISVVSRHHPVPRHSRCVSTASFGHGIVTYAINTVFGQ